MIYRRRINTYFWHFCQNCRDWPTEQYDNRIERPESGLDLCDECQSLLLKKECRPLV